MQDYGKRNCVLICMVCCNRIIFIHKNTGTYCIFFFLPLVFTLHHFNGKIFTKTNKKNLVANQQMTIAILVDIKSEVLIFCLTLLLNSLTNYGLIIKKKKGKKKEKQFTVMEVIEELSVFPTEEIITIGSDYKCSCCQKKQIHIIKKVQNHLI